MKRISLILFGFYSVSDNIFNKFMVTFLLHQYILVANVMHVPKESGMFYKWRQFFPREIELFLYFMSFFLVFLYTCILFIKQVSKNLKTQIQYQFHEFFKRYSFFFLISHFLFQRCTAPNLNLMII